MSLGKHACKLQHWLVEAHNHNVVIVVLSCFVVFFWLNYVTLEKVFVSMKIIVTHIRFSEKLNEDQGVNLFKTSAIIAAVVNVTSKYAGKT